MDFKLTITGRIDGPDGYNALAALTMIAVSAKVQVEDPGLDELGVNGVTTEGVSLKVETREYV